MIKYSKNKEVLQLYNNIDKIRQFDQQFCLFFNALDYCLSDNYEDMFYYICEESDVFSVEEIADLTYTNRKKINKFISFVNALVIYFLSTKTL